MVKRKVIVRLWLGILREENDINSFKTKNMIEMDQFVVTLSGEQSQVISRLSRDSAATMKELTEGTLVDQLMFDIKNKRESGYWCGLPHHLLVPRSRAYVPTDENLGGEDYVLYAFVTDTEDDIVVGSDGIPHMLCGHKNNAKTDVKPYGFPFDKKINFQLSDTSNFMASTKVKILFTQLEKLREIGEKVKNMGGLKKEEEKPADVTGGEVSCGGHTATTCGECGDETYCHGDCSWVNNKCSKTQTTGTMDTGCSCNGHLLDGQYGECRHPPKSKICSAWCYVSDSSTCKDVYASSKGVPYKWSCQPCQERPTPYT